MPPPTRSSLRRLAADSLATGLIAVIVSTLAPPALAQLADADPSDRELGLRLATEGRCEPALETLIPLRTRPPSDAEVERVVGECAIRQQRFGLAVQALEAARALDSKTPSVDLYLAIAHFHEGDTNAAAAALARAQATDSDRPEFLLYSGLVAFERADYATAVGRLDAASQLSGRPVEPIASFYLGRALGQTRQRELALQAFTRVLADYPGSVWAQQAQSAIDALEEGGGRQWWAALEVGFEQDDNVLLRGTGVGLPSEISGQTDQSGFWFVDAGALLFNSRGWSGGATIRYGGSEYNDLHEFDTQAPGGTLWVDRELGVADASLRLQYDFDAAWIDEDPFLLSHEWTGSVYKPWDSGGYTLVSTSAGLDDYRYDTVDLDPWVAEDPPGSGSPPPGVCRGVCGPPGVDEANTTDRDGKGWIASLLHREPLPEIAGNWLVGPWIEGGYLYGRYWSQGREYDHQRHQVDLSLGVELPFAILLSVRGLYAYVPYDNASSFADPKDIEAVPAGRPIFLDDSQRREQEVGVRVLVERAFGENVLLRARWTRTSNFSTSDVFDYHRDVFGISVRIGLSGAI